MHKVIFGKKLGMGESYLGEVRVGVTRLALIPMTVSQLKSVEKDGYRSLQVGFDAPRKNSRRQFRTYREIPFTEGVTLGSVITPTKIIAVGSVCSIQGTSKGKGFAGVVKRWNFAGGPRTHGQSDRLRAPGSIGQGTTPGRVLKGKHMAGHMGNDTVTMKKALVISFDPETNLATVSGPVPGAIGSLVRLEVVGEPKVGEAQS